MVPVPRVVVYCFTLFFNIFYLINFIFTVNIIDKLNEKYPKSSEPSVRTRAYSEKAKDFGKEGQAGMKRGGMAKGGKWIQSAIKRPGALKKSLGVPMDKPIPAAKLEKASKAPGKMGQRARLAMTLKGMK